jgi:hypothetical protein
MALDCYLKAAEQGFAEAQRNLGAMYVEGVGVAVDLVQAHKWLNLAALAGNESAGKELKQLEGKMSREQIDLAWKQAQEWLGKHK